MQIIPAIDIRAGRCVRLTQGDYDRETVFSDDPAAMAVRWQDAGASRLHVVDLDGAREGHPINAAAIQAVSAAATVPVQVGGGVRDIATIDQYLNAGVQRVVLGTTAVKDQTTLLDAITLFRDRIIVGIDARDGMVATEGWLETSSLAATVLVQQLAELGVSRIIYTDISRDGMLAGPNFDSISALVDQASHQPSPIAVIASGGVSSLDHIRRLADLGVEGVIIGTALYTGAIDLKEALASLR
jgi:phosphoribosylformimino-5-aminoimidazole carboxamide ribotide isomerase